MREAPLPGSVVLALELAEAVLRGLAWRVLLVAARSGLVTGEGRSQMVSLSAVPWNLTTSPGGQTECGLQRAQDLVADV